MSSKAKSIITDHHLIKPAPTPAEPEIKLSNPILDNLTSKRGKLQAEIVKDWEAEANRQHNEAVAGLRAEYERLERKHLAYLAAGKEVLDENIRLNTLEEALYEEIEALKAKQQARLEYIADLETKLGIKPKEVK